MVKNNKFILSIIAGLTLFLGTSSYAGCWVVWQGIHSHTECDSAGVTPTFESLKQSINEMSHASPDCKRSIIRTVGSYYSCGYSIYQAVQTGGATVWVGAGEACYEFNQEVRDNQRYCQQYVNLRSKPVRAKVCNGRNEKIFVAIARREVREAKVTSGWWPLEHNQCRDFSFANARVIYAMAKTASGQRIWPDYHNNELDDNATFCINKTLRFDDLNVETCHNRPQENPYDYNKPGSLKFTTFGRISGLSNGFRF